MQWFEFPQWIIKSYLIQSYRIHIQSYLKTYKVLWFCHIILVDLLTFHLTGLKKICVLAVYFSATICQGMQVWPWQSLYHPIMHHLELRAVVVSCERCSTVWVMFPPNRKSQAEVEQPIRKQNKPKKKRKKAGACLLVRCNHCMHSQQK